MRVNVIKMQGKNYDEFYGNGRQLNKEYNKYAISMEKLKIFHSFNRLDGLTTVSIRNKIQSLSLNYKSLEILLTKINFYFYLKNFGQVLY